MHHPLRRPKLRVSTLAVVIATVIAALGQQAAASFALGPADGILSGGATVFDDGAPAVANLDPGLLAALRRAATAAAKDGVELRITSGWRSRAYQEQLLREAVTTYGSLAAAARWVATPDTSPHVSGDAVDMDGFAAANWLATRGARYGLCQVYGNEPWHFELRSDAARRGCPPTYVDPTRDPRMHVETRREGEGAAST